MSLALDTARLDEYLASLFGEPVEIVALRSLGGEVLDDPKGFGYGKPFEIECRVAGRPRQLVVSRTRPAQGFSHDYPADRAWQALYGHAAYNDFPRHVRSLDVGFLRPSGELVSAADAIDFFQLVEKAEGHLYWLDLDRLLEGRLDPLDTQRTQALARFLADAHATKRDEPTLYARRIRELVGHGECVMGILDSYPTPLPCCRRRRARHWRSAMVRWRWRLRDRAPPSVAHAWRFSSLEHPVPRGDGLQRSRPQPRRVGRAGRRRGRAGHQLPLLRHAQGRPARGAGVAEPFRGLFHDFLNTYIETSRDYELLETLPPFLAFRALVLAHPRWYPDLPGSVRSDLAHLAGSLTQLTRFDPADVSWLCGVAR